MLLCLAFAKERKDKVYRVHVACTHSFSFSISFQPPQESLVNRGPYTRFRTISRNIARITKLHRLSTSEIYVFNVTDIELGCKIESELLAISQRLPKRSVSV